MIQKIKNFFRHNYLGILYYNLKLFPFKKAVRLPLDLAYDVSITAKRGSVILKTNQLHRGTVSIGFQSSDLFGRCPVNIDIQGELIIEGDGIVIGSGTTIKCVTSGVITIGGDTCIGARNLIICEEKVTIGNHAIFSWDCQIMDTDTHSLVSLEDGLTRPRHSSVNIGNNTWISNHVTINKGTILPAGCIVASNSLCNKDYSSLGENSLLAGIPARKIAANMKMGSDKL